jgi:hypothetical protein
MNERAGIAAWKNPRRMIPALASRSILESSPLQPLASLAMLPATAPNLGHSLLAIAGNAPAWPHR